MSMSIYGAYDKGYRCMYSLLIYGSCRAGRATVFPSPIALGATFNTQLLRDIGGIIATEARGKHNDYAAKHQGNTDTFFGQPND